MSFALLIRRGVVVNTDPQRRCYHGAHFSSRTDWSEWERWLGGYPTRESAEHAASLFEREDQQFKVVEEAA